jgi:hypothetical protein
VPEYVDKASEEDTNGHPLFQRMMDSVSRKQFDPVFFGIWTASAVKGALETLQHLQSRLPPMTGTGSRSAKNICDQQACLETLFSATPTPTITTKCVITEGLRVAAGSVRPDPISIRTPRRADIFRMERRQG